MRGLTVALMILVNNGGEHNYSFLEHSKWNGLTPCDLVFPFFLFMVGMSTFISLKKTEFKPSAHVYRKIAKRTILLFLIGLGINWFDMICSGDALDFAHLRIWAVLQRIAICYGVVALLAITLNHRYFIHTIIGLLVVYMGILVFGKGRPQHFRHQPSLSKKSGRPGRITEHDSIHRPYDDRIPLLQVHFRSRSDRRFEDQGIEGGRSRDGSSRLRTLPDWFRHQQAHLESQLRIRNLRIRLLDIGHPVAVYRQQAEQQGQHPDQGSACLWHESAFSLCDERGTCHPLWKF